MDNCPYTLFGCPHTFGHTAYVETDIEKKTLLHDKLRKNLSLARNPPGPTPQAKLFTL